MASAPRHAHRPEHRHTVVAAESDAGLMNENADLVETTRAAADAALAVWLEMWNTGGEIARRICSADFRIHFLNSGHPRISPRPHPTP